MSDDIKHFREAVAKFDELKLELEDIKGGLEKNFENYKNISDISGEIAEKNEGVLESINTLQINATTAVEDAIKKAADLKEEMGKYYSAEYTQTKKDLDTLLSSVESELSTLKATINKNISDAVRNAVFDTTDITENFNKSMTLLDKEHSKKFNSLKEKTERTNRSIGNYHRKFDDVKIDLDKALQEIETKSEKVNDAVKNINSANKSISMAMTFSMLFVGIVIGFGVATYFKIDAISDNYFSSYEKKQVNLSLDQERIQTKIAKLDKVSQILLDSGNILSYGKYEDTDVRYIKITNAFSDNSGYTFTRNGSAFVGLKN